VRVALGVAFVGVLAIGNLRGIRESATIFALPTYVYLVAIFGLLAYGLFRFVTGTLPDYTAPPAWQLQETVGPLGILLVLRAFASGSVALTGVEAVSNGVPAFKRPESRNAQVVLILMGSFFGAIFLGMSFLAGQLGILPDPTEQETVVSQLTRTFVGTGTPYHYLVQISTALLLVLAANTAFADFPRLGSILARDRFAPHYFQFRGDRLAFTTGIVVLALLSAVLIVAFAGSVTALIPLYTVGVFVAFTLSDHGRSYWIAFPVALVIAFAGGIAIQRIVIRPVERAPILTMVIVTLGLATLVNGLAGFIFGYVPRSFPSPFSVQTVDILGAFVSYRDLGVIAYLGVPLITPEGQALGSLCVIDHEPRIWTKDEISLVTDIAAAVITEITLRTTQRNTPPIAATAS